MGSRDNGSRELFTQSLYAQSVPVGAKKEKEKDKDMSMAPKSMPATPTPTSTSMSRNPSSSPATTPSKGEMPRNDKSCDRRDDRKEKEEKTMGDRGRERERQQETTQQPTENSLLGKAPPDAEKKKKKKKGRGRITSAGSCSVADDKTVNATERDDFPVLEKKLREFNFYHGFLPREDLQSTLQNPGDYLLRVSEVVEGETKVNREVILSLIPILVEGKDEDDKKKCRNVCIKRVQQSNKFFCEMTRLFDSISDLINYYTKNTGTCSAGTFQLKTPILQQPWEFMHSDVTVGDKLGEGAFGKVCQGTLKLKDGSTVEVAIKMTKVSAFLSKIKIKEMMNEARFIRNFNNKNVVRLYGVAHDEQPLYILLELVKGGSLLDHLKAAKTNGTIVTVAERIKFCIGAGKGIEYLHRNNCIHRDIAARNCLLHDKEVKITDFGLSRTGPSYKMKTSCKLPVKWLAPETLSTFTFSYATDVYSWGITCNEVFADGAEPFEGVSNAVVKADTMALKFLPMHPNCPEAIRKYMGNFIFVDGGRRATMSMALVEFDRLTLMCENGGMDGGGAKQKILKVFKKKHEKQSKGD